MREKIFTSILTLVVWGFIALYGPWLTSAQETASDISEPTSAETTKSEVEAVMKASPTGIIERSIGKGPKVPVILARSVQFQTTSGEPVILDEGNYLVQISETSPLKISSETGDEQWELVALTGSHEEKLTDPDAQSIPGPDEDQHHLVLLLPSGKTIDAGGSYSGVSTRATTALKASFLTTARTPVVSQVLLKDKPLIPMASTPEYYPGLLRDQVIVKFKDGAPVRTETAPGTTAKPALKFAAPLLDSKARSLMQKLNLSEAKIQNDLNKVNEMLKRPMVKKVSSLFSRADTFLRAERQQAEERTGKEHADLGNYITLQLEPGSKGEEVAAELNALSSVEVAYLAPIPVDAQADITPSTPNRESNQGYLNAAPQGIDAKYSWTFPGGKGEGIRVIDIERNWFLQHEDLPTSFLTNGSISTNTDHGTAVLGEMVAGGNNYGVTGIANKSGFGVVSVIRPGGNYSVAEAVNLAAGRLSRGDVILIEQHAKGPASDQQCTCNCGQFEYIAMEYWQAEFDAMKAATSRGIHVVEAAGNGSMNLDAARYNNRFNRTTRDSGAIIVGAYDGNLRPTCWTNRGNRVDVHGWGQNVWSTGYGTPASNQVNGNDRRQWYTNSFSGTSSASPIVAGAVMDLMGIRRAAGIEGMNPVQLRTLLRNTGTPQQNTTAGQIGPLPNLRNAISQLKLEDCVGFNPNNVTATKISGRWKVVDGSHWLLDFGNDQASANKARNTIRNYGMNKTCYIGRPNPSMSYWLAGNQPPTGAYSGEDCTSFNPANVRVQRVSGRWKITEGSHWIADFGSKEHEARAALKVIQRYEFKRQCFVKRPNASMKYWRK